MRCRQTVLPKFDVHMAGRLSVQSFRVLLRFVWCRRCDCVSMLSLAEDGDVIDILSGLALHAVEKRVLHQSDLKVRDV